MHTHEIAVQSAPTSVEALMGSVFPDAQYKTKPLAPHALVAQSNVAPHPDGLLAHHNDFIFKASRFPKIEVSVHSSLDKYENGVGSCART